MSDLPSPQDAMATFIYEAGAEVLAGHNQLPLTPRADRPSGPRPAAGPADGRDGGGGTG
jgi:hypothetical protein